MLIVPSSHRSSLLDTHASAYKLASVMTQFWVTVGAFEAAHPRL